MSSPKTTLIRICDNAYKREDVKKLYILHTLEEPYAGAGASAKPFGLWVEFVAAMKSQHELVKRFATREEVNNALDAACRQ
jgi:hypothetical protein